MSQLDKIDKPDDLKKLDLSQLNALSQEIRSFLIESISKTGGHLSSNLGVVELTVALHYCFDMPKDKIIWDVGHQTYVHKILTGRKDQFRMLRKYKGLSGYPKSCESEYDSFDTGHSSTSISAGFGMAVSRDLKKEKYNVVSVIGDGSMTGGLAYEALNNAGRSKTNFIVILNDNEMSIAENVGAVSRHLNKIRTAPSYLGAKKDVHNFLKKIPFLGRRIGKLIEKVKEGIKYFLISGILFEEFGFKYIGPIDGHNIEEIVKVLNQAKKIEGPVLLHIYTKKGKGYKYAEEYPERFHGIDLFDISTGSDIKEKTKNTYSDIFGYELVRIAEENEAIVAITAAMPSGTGLNRFMKAFPERIFDVGIAEGHAVTFAAGMAKNGMIPVFAVYSSFLQRSFDQIIHDVCIQKLPVIFAIDRAGVVGADGETHQGLFDLSYLSMIPNITVLAPRNGYELKQMLRFAVTLNAPVAVRYPRGVDSKALKEKKQAILLGKCEVIQHGRNIAIVSVGTMMDHCYEVYQRLKNQGIDPGLYNARFIKPIDEKLLEYLLKYEHVFIVEDNISKGGFGSNVLEELSRRIEYQARMTTVHLLSFPDEFVEQGSIDELFAQYGLDVGGIYNSITDVIKNEIRSNFPQRKQQSI